MTVCTPLVDEPVADVMICALSNFPLVHSNLSTKEYAYGRKLMRAWNTGLVHMLNGLCSYTWLSNEILP